MGICTINFIEKGVLIYSFGNYTTYINENNMSKAKILANFMSICTNNSIGR